MLQKRTHLPTAHRLLPFVFLSYEQPSIFLWLDDAGIAHDITQTEGGEQGDALMPALFCLGLQDALNNARARLRLGEELIAFSDNIYIVTENHAQGQHMISSQKPSACTPVLKPTLAKQNVGAKMAAQLQTESMNSRQVQLQPKIQLQYRQAAMNPRV